MEEQAKFDAIVMQFGISADAALAFTQIIEEANTDAYLRGVEAADYSNAVGQY